MKRRKHFVDEYPDTSIMLGKVEKKIDMRFKSNKLARRKHRIRFLMLLIFIEIIFLSIYIFL